MPPPITTIRRGAINGSSWPASGRMWREASAKRFENGQFSGVELGIDGIREFGFRGEMPSESLAIGCGTS
jgi:hypothetical protein